MRRCAPSPFSPLVASARLRDARAALRRGPQAAIFDRLRALCGNAYRGRVVTSDAADREMAAARLVMQVRACSDGEVRIPFHVGDDRSRIWVVTRTAAGLRLKQSTVSATAGEDVRSQYGGDTVAPGNARRQEFPADAFSRDLFVRENIPESITNVWAIEVVPGEIFAYELRRPGRISASSSTSPPVAAPPPPWGER